MWYSHRVTRPAEVVHPCEEPFHFPSPAISPELASILGFCSDRAGWARSFRCRIPLELAIERVRVVGFVTDEPGGELVEEASGKNVFHKLALGRRSAVDRYGERKTVISGDSDDFRALAATGGTDGEAPFLALAKVASTNASSRFSFPRSCRRRANSFSASSSFPLAPTAGTGDGRSGRADISPAAPATVLRCPEPRAHRSAPRVCHATDDHDYPPADLGAALAPARFQRPVMAVRGYPRVAPRIERISPLRYLGDRF